MTGKLAKLKLVLALVLVTLSSACSSQRPSLRSRMVAGEANKDKPTLNKGFTGNIGGVR